MERSIRHRPRASAISLDFDDRRQVAIGRVGSPAGEDDGGPKTGLAAQWRSALAAPEGAWAPSRLRPVGPRRGPRRTEGVGRLLRARAEDRSWLVATAGEERTADRLERLGQADPRWRFVHAFRVGEREPAIEHLAIGPGGVFVITTKHHPHARVWVRGNVLVVNGERKPYVRAARRAALLAAQRLGAGAGTEVPVAGLIALVDAHGLTVSGPPSDVSVVHQRAVVRWLRSQPEVLDEATIGRLEELARRG